MAELAPTNHSEIIESIFSVNPHLRPANLNSRYDGSARTKVLSTLKMVPLLGRVLPAVNERKEEIARLLAEQKTATSYKTWYDISARLDELTGNNTWKLSPESPHYDYDLVFENMMEMRNARLSKDYRLLIYLIRTRWTRNFGNMGDLNLYRHSHVGTKKLIEEYIDECQESLHWLVTDLGVNLDDRYLLGMLIQTRKNIGRTALLLSGGSTFGVSHIGVLIALLENNLLPRIISGSSSGSIIASILCCHTNEEILELLAGITERQFSIFGKPDADSGSSKLKVFLERISHFLKFGTFFDISGLQETMYNFVGELTFREAYNRTGKILNITVSPASIHEQTRLLNYLTAPHCLVWSAVCASCSLPGIFPSNTIYEKNPRTNEIHEWNNDDTSKYVDGSVDGDLPITRLSEMFNVDHIIAVQVNPHVSPVLKIAVGSVGGQLDGEFKNTLRGIMNDCYDFVTSEMIHYLQVLHEMNLYKNLTLKAVSILSQKYSGDITILPELNLKDFLKIFQNPTPEFLLEFILKGARASWPKMTVINNHCRVEFALDKEISYLRGRLVSSANKRLTYTNGESLKATANFMKRGESNSYLISSPVLNSDNLQTPVKNRKENAPSIRRYNSHSNGHATANEQAEHQLRKRNSISLGETSKAVQRGKSTTSLQNLRTNFGPSDGPETVSAFDQASFDKLFADGYDVELSSKSETQNVTIPKPIRKAQSSSNFHTPKDPAESPGLFSFRASPKFERSIHYVLDYDNLAKKFTGNDKAGLSKEKANLPKLSKPNSVRNSYVGLNHLKDQTKSNVNSLNATNDNSRVNLTINSGNSSSQDLKEYYSSTELASKVLDSNKLHRYLAKLRPGVVTNMSSTSVKPRKATKVKFSKSDTKEREKFTSKESSDGSFDHDLDGLPTPRNNFDEDAEETEKEGDATEMKFSSSLDDQTPAAYYPYD